MKYKLLLSLLFTGVFLTACNSVSKETLDRGAELYSKCSECHGANGKKKALEKSAIIQGQSKTEIEKKLKAYQAGTRNETGMGTWKKGIMREYSDSDIEALAVYISTL